MVVKSFNSCITLCNYIITICISITSILTTQVLLKSGDSETNSGPKRSSAIRFYHWILNGLAAHDFVKVPLIEAFINEKCFFTCLYRSPSQSHEELESFCSNLDLLLSNINDQHPACSIIMGDFNAKYWKWCTTDKNNTAGLEIDSITTASGYSQTINKPTHFINKSSSCIDLIFSSNTSFVKNRLSELPIYEKCSHGTLNFHVPLPPPYYRDIWD